MTQPDPDSSQGYDPYELFTEELDLDSFDLEQAPLEAKSEAIAESPFSMQDEDRLYTDELIRQNEMASRSLFLSVLAAAVISVGIGLWYLLTQQKPTPQPTAPLPVPEQPIVPSPGLSTPIVPLTPLPSPTVSPTVPGSLPGGLPSPNNSTRPAQPSPGGTVVPPTNRPNSSVQPSPSGAVVPPPPPTAVPGNPGR